MEEGIIPHVKHIPQYYEGKVLYIPSDKFPGHEHGHPHIEDEMRIMLDAVMDLRKVVEAYHDAFAVLHARIDELEADRITG